MFFNNAHSNKRKAILYNEKTIAALKETTFNFAIKRRKKNWI